MTPLEPRGPGVLEGSPMGALEMLPASTGDVTEAITVHRSQWELFRRRFLRHRMALVSIGVLLFLCLVCFGANWFAPFRAGKTGVPQDLLLGPVGPNGAHWFGTDELGRDQLSR